MVYEEVAEVLVPYLCPREIAGMALTSKTLHRVAASVTAARSSDASRGLEKYPIPFLNTVDHHPYSYFAYTPISLILPNFHTSSSSSSWGAAPPPKTLRSQSYPASIANDGYPFGCSCEGDDGSCEEESECSCCYMTFSPDADADADAEQVMTECGVNCSCGPRCQRRLTQGGIAVRLAVVRDSRKGWGLHAAQFIRSRDFICEYAGIVLGTTHITGRAELLLLLLLLLSLYFAGAIHVFLTFLSAVINNDRSCVHVGELVTSEEARRRQREYDELASQQHQFSHALLVVREHLPSGKACLRINIDATRVGNVARFINHSCDGGNLSTVLVRNTGALLPRLCFFAARDIAQGEELSFSYGDTRMRSKGLHCFCGSSCCFGTLPSEHI
ncbi:hypothetical protein ACLOJK_040799 [Asimina triloba]